MGMSMDSGVSGLVAGAALGALLAHNQKSATPQPVQPQPAPQLAHGPNAGAMLSDMQQTAAAQPSTFLTGPGGVDTKKVKTVRPMLYSDDTDS
jgi:hypothetical protein